MPYFMSHGNIYLAPRGSNVLANHPMLGNAYNGSNGDLIHPHVCLLLILNQLVTKVQVYIPVIL